MDIVSGEPPLYGGQSVWLGLWQLVVDELHAVVGLDTTEGESWGKETDSMLQESHSVNGVHSRI
jgi:hypothetical protein